MRASSTPRVAHRTIAALNRRCPEGLDFERHAASATDSTPPHEATLSALHDRTHAAVVAGTAALNATALIADADQAHLTGNTEKTLDLITQATTR